MHPGSYVFLLLPHFNLQSPLSCLSSQPNAHAGAFLLLPHCSLHLSLPPLLPPEACSSSPLPSDLQPALASPPVWSPGAAVLPPPLLRPPPAPWLGPHRPLLASPVLFFGRRFWLRRLHAPLLLPPGLTRRRSPACASPARPGGQRCRSALPPAPPPPDSFPGSVPWRRLCPRSCAAWLGSGLAAQRAPAPCAPSSLGLRPLAALLAPLRLGLPSALPWFPFSLTQFLLFRIYKPCACRAPSPTTPRPPLCSPLV